MNTAVQFGIKLGKGWTEAALMLGLAILTAGTILFPALGLPIMMVAAGGIVLWVLTCVLHGNTESLMTWWVLTFPLGYFFVAFPRQKAIITLDRLLIGVLVVGVVFAGRQALGKIPKPLSSCALAWFAFLVVAGASLFKASELMVSVRWYVDGFILPAVLGWYIVSSFPVRKHLAALHTFSCLMAVYVCVIGAMEFFTRTNIIPLPGSGPLVYAGRFARPHGPFYNDDSFALIGLITFFLILFLRHALGLDWSRQRQALHFIGLACSVANALMPLFRSVGITLLLIMVLDNFFERKVTKRLAKVLLIAVFVAALFGAAALVPDAASDRSNPDNFYVRIAEQKQILLVFLDHPIFGIGILNFKSYVQEQSRYIGLYHGTQSLDSPHSNLGGILAETGITGFVPYITAQVLLVLAFFKMMKSGVSDGRYLWKYFTYVFLSYWVSGLTLASGYNSDLNLWFMFVTMVIYKYAMTAEVQAPVSHHVRDFRFTEPAPNFAFAGRRGY